MLQIWNDFCQAATLRTKIGLENNQKWSGTGTVLGFGMFFLYVFFCQVNQTCHHLRHVNCNWSVLGNTLGKSGDLDDDEPRDVLQYQVVFCNRRVQQWIANQPLKDWLVVWKNQLKQIVGQISDHPKKIQKGWKIRKTRKHHKTTNRSEQHNPGRTRPCV